MKITVIAKTKKKENKVIKVDDTTYKVYVKEAPEEGKANKAILKLLAEYFNVPKANIQLLLGETSKQKVFVII